MATRPSPRRFETALLIIRAPNRRVDLIAGTSTGSIIALLLAAGYDPEDVTRSYEVACPEIFRRPEGSLWPFPPLAVWRAK